MPTPLTATRCGYIPVMALQLKNGPYMILQVAHRQLSLRQLQVPRVISLRLVCREALQLLIMALLRQL
jgi:hypothetical protein